MLAADFANLQKECEMINNSDADWFHLDVMDGVFVPNISFGIPVIKHINEHTLKPLDVHLMIVQPERYITHFKEVGTNILTVHLEASPHLHRTLQAIKDEGMKAGVALNPHTNVEQLMPIIEEIDLVCCFITHATGSRNHAEQSIDNTPTARNGDIPRVSGARNRLIDGGRK